MAPIRILLADDDAAARRAARDALAGAGFEVLEAADGAELVAGALDGLPALILADLLLPGLDGFEAVAELRRHGSTAAIPWLYLSTLDDAETRTQGVARFLMKPFEREDLIAAVRAVAPATGPGTEAPLILVVDDERDIVEIVCDYLGDAGYRGAGCYDGRAAVAAVERRPPAALVLDVKMPELDGYGVIRWVKRHPVHRTIPIIILTATKVLRITHGTPPQPNPFATVTTPCGAARLVAAVREVLGAA